MKVRTILVLGLFWIFVLSMVSVSAVAADGLYWGDSVTDPTADDPFFEEPFAPLEKEKVKKDKKDKDELIPEPIIMEGLYWGD